MLFNKQKLTFCKLFGSIRDRDEFKEFIKISLILMVLLIIFFYKIIFFGLYPSAADILAFWPLFRFEDVQIQNILLSDVVVQLEPWFWLNYFDIQHSQIPLWNPYCATGVPHMANMISTVFFPLTWPIYILGLTKFSLLSYYFIKLYLTGVFCYYYLKSIKLDLYSSLIGSIAFMFIGFNIVWLYYPTSNPIFILPASLYLIEKIIGSQSDKKYLLAFSIVIALGVFAGHPETFFHIAVASFLYFVFRLIVKKKALISDKIKILRNYILFSLLGIAISAVQLLPFLEYLSNSYAWVVRSNARYMLDWHTAILNLIPAFYGSPSIYHRIPYYISFTNYNESAAGYVGISMLIFAAFALIAKYKDNFVRFYLLLTVWVIGVTYGLPLIFDFTVSLPLFSHAANNRLLFLLGFNVVVLGSIGLNKILEEVRGNNKKYILNKFVISVLIVILVLFALSLSNRGFLYLHSNFNEGTIRAQSILVLLTCVLVLLTLILIYILIKYARNPQLKTACLIGLLLLVFAQTGIYGMLFEPAIEEKYFYPRIEAFDLINEKDMLYRVTSIDNIGSVYPVNTQMIYGIYDIRNYDALEIKYYWELLNVFAEGRIHGWVDLLNVDKRFLDFTGVKWIFSRDDLSKDKGIHVGGGTNTVGELIKGTGVEQEFISQRENLSKIELFFSTYGKEYIDSNVTISLIEKDTNKMVRIVNFNSRAIRDNQWYPVEFTPLVNSSNTTYILRITSDGNPGQSITIWMNNASEDVNVGKLYLNGTAIAGSLCFNTYHNKQGNIILFKKYPGYYLFENKDVQPRAFIVQNAVFKSSDTEILNVLNNKSFNWKSSVVISGRNHAVQYPLSENNVRIVKYEPTYIKIKVNTTQHGFLVLSDSYYPGWNAYINGGRIDILRANYAFRAVELPKGENMVEFKYEPLSFYVGGLISLIALLVLSIIFFIQKGSRMSKSK